MTARNRWKTAAVYALITLAILIALAFASSLIRNRFSPPSDFMTVIEVLSGVVIGAVAHRLYLHRVS
jgi:threonine/homoserine/homoserine lactone efflux protein